MHAKRSHSLVKDPVVHVEMVDYTKTAQHAPKSVNFQSVEVGHGRRSRRLMKLGVYGIGLI